MELTVNSRFQTTKHTCALLWEWKALALKKIMVTNTEKEPSTCHESLFEKLLDIQTSLPSEYRSERILHNKLLNAVRDFESCLLAYHKHTDAVQEVISDQHASLATIKLPSGSSAESSAQLVDRLYVRQNIPRQAGSSRNNKCFVFKRPGCWSTNPSTKECLKAFCGSKLLRQFMALLEPNNESDDEKRKAADTIEEIISHTIDMWNGREDADPLKTKILSHTLGRPKMKKYRYYTPVEFRMTWCLMPSRLKSQTGNG